MKLHRCCIQFRSFLLDNLADSRALVGRVEHEIFVAGSEKFSLLLISHGTLLQSGEEVDFSSVGLNVLNSLSSVEVGKGSILFLLVAFHRSHDTFTESISEFLERRR